MNSRRENRPLCLADATVRRMNLYEQPSSMHRQLSMWANSVGFHRGAVAQGLVDNRTLGSFGAVWISQGQGWFESELTVRQRVTPGTLIWLFPDVAHSYFTDGGPWVEQWVLFGGMSAAGLERHGFFKRSNPVIQLGDAPEVSALFTRLEETFIRGGPLAVPVAGTYAEQLILTVHSLAVGLSEDLHGAEPLSVRALRIIQHEATSGLNPIVLAKRLHTGYSTLRRRFKIETGYSVKEYILNAQMKHAKERLASTRRSIESIAAESGFPDPYHFSRQFRAREGMSPRAFRKYHSRLALE